LCPPKPHSLATKVLKQLIYNYATFIPWKCEEFILKVEINNNNDNNNNNDIIIIIVANKKIMELYCSCILIPQWNLIQMNGHIVYTILVNHV